MRKDDENDDIKFTFRVLRYYVMSRYSIVITLSVADETTQVRISPPAVVFITTATAIYSLGHGLCTLTAVDSAFYPPWDGKMSISLWAE